MDQWDCCLAETELADRIHSLVNGPSFVMFMKKGDDIFGAPEESRVVFAKMKSGDKDMPDGWEDDASFMAINLSKVVRNQGAPQIVFGRRDLSNIKVIDKDKAENLLRKQSKESGGGVPGSPHAAKIALVIKKHRVIPRDED